VFKATILTLACLCAEGLKAGVITTVPETGNRTESRGVIDAVPFKPAPGGGIVIEARLNGRGPFQLLLDTGSSHSAISGEVAKSLGATPVGRVVIASPIGESVRVIVRLDRFEIGPTVTTNVLASVIPAEAAGRLQGFQGLIGQDVLATERYTIDFRSRRLLWYGDDVTVAGQSLPLEFDSGRALVTLPQRAGALRLIPDSAAQGLVLFRHRDLRLPTWSPSGADVDLATLVERRNAQRVILDELRIGGSILWRVPATIVGDETPRGTAPADDAPRCDGLLPLHFFDRVTFDGPRHLMVVEGARTFVGRTE
jgi:predicted aspartyl protease